MAIQPWDYITSNNLGYLEGTAIKYLSRWRSKNGIEDLRKAIHFIEKLIEVELARSGASPVEHRSISTALLNKLVDESLATRFYVASATTESCGTPYCLPTGELNDIAIMRPDSA